MGGVILLILLLLECLQACIENFRHEYKIKHRFDKPPTAKCYCLDCVYFNRTNGNGKCTNSHIDKDWHIADSWFCWRATPRSKDLDN